MLRTIMVVQGIKGLRMQNLLTPENIHKNKHTFQSAVN